MTLTTPQHDNGNDAHAPQSSDAIPMIIAGVVVAPVLVGVLWILQHLFSLAIILDQPY